jgi:bacterial/archaeal transporter family protein
MELISIITGLVTMFCWGVGAFLQSIVTRKIGTLKAQFIISFLAFIPLLLVYIFFRDLLVVSFENLGLIFLAGLTLVFGLYNMIKGIEIGDISIVMPLSGSNSLVTVLLAFFVLNEVLSLPKIISIVLIFVGIIFTSINFKKIKSIRKKKGVKEGIFALVFQGISFFIVSVILSDISRYGIYSEPMHYISLYFYSTLINSILFLLFAVIKKQIPTKNDLKSIKIVGIQTINMVLFNVAWIVLNYGISIGKVSIIMPITSLNIAVTIILAVIFYKEKLITSQKLGILIVLVGLVLISI